MKLNGIIYSKVDVDPIDVINGLISELIQHRQWITTEDKKHYIKEEAYRNSEAIIRQITNDEFKYYSELESIKAYLKLKAYIK